MPQSKRRRGEKRLTARKLFRVKRRVRWIRICRFFVAEHGTMRGLTDYFVSLSTQMRQMKADFTDEHRFLFRYESIALFLNVFAPNCDLYDYGESSIFARQKYKHQEWKS
jgi:hypothetical protein